MSSCGSGGGEGLPSTHLSVALRSGQGPGLTPTERALVCAPRGAARPLRESISYWQAVAEARVARGRRTRGVQELGETTQPGGISGFSTRARAPRGPRTLPSTRPTSVQTPFRAPRFMGLRLPQTPKLQSPLKCSHLSRRLYPLRGVDGSVSCYAPVPVAVGPDGWFALARGVHSP